MGMGIGRECKAKVGVVVVFETELMGIEGVKDEL